MDGTEERISTGLPTVTLQFATARANRLNKRLQPLVERTLNHAVTQSPPWR